MAPESRFAPSRRRGTTVLVVIAGVASALACSEPADRTEPENPPDRETTVEDVLEQADDAFEERRYSDAEALYQEAREIAPAQLQWPALHGWMSARLRLGHHQDAASHLAALHRLAGDDPAWLAETARAAAAIHHREGDLATAERDAERALDYARRAGDRGLEIEALSMLATVHSLAGRNREAMRLHEERLAAERQTRRGPGKLAMALNELAIDYRHLGRFQEALELYAESRRIFRSIGDPEGEAMVAFNSGNVYRATGDDLEALELTRQALSLVEPLGSTYGLGLTHKALGDSYLSGGNLLLARRHLQQALVIHRSASQAYGEVGALIAMGRLERQDGDLPKSLEILRQSIALAEDHGYTAELALGNIELCLSVTAAGRPVEGLERAERALVLATEQDDAELELLAEEARANALEALADHGAALAAYRNAMELLESWRGRLELGDLAATVGDLHWGVYEGAVRCLFVMGRVEEAFEVSERARARLLLELMAERQPPPSEDEPIALLKQRIREIRAALVSASDEQRADLNAELARFEGELRRLEDRLGAENPRRADLLFPHPRSLAEIRTRLVTHDRSILAFFWGEGQVYGWWIEDGAIRGRSLGESSSLARQVDFLRSVLSNPRSAVDWRPAARRTYEVLVQPLRPGRTATILAVPDGPLAYVPLETLIRPASARPLVTDSRILYGPSASVLFALFTPAEPRPRKGENARGRSALIVAYSPNRGERDSLGPLPAATAEARELARILARSGQGDVEIIQGNDATRERWLAADPTRYAILHFATHAVVDDAHPERSHLVFAHSELDAASIRRLHLRAGLVTLSACETGLGRPVRGEGFIGLTHAFLAAGARSVVATSWRIGDPTTADFMQSFYEKVAAGETVAAALQTTKQAWALRRDERGHPSRWAPYISVGGP